MHRMKHPNIVEFEVSGDRAVFRPDHADRRRENELSNSDVRSAERNIIFHILETNDNLVH